MSIHDLREQKLVQYYEAHHDIVNDISIHPQGNYFSSVSNNSEIKVFYNLFRSGISGKVASPILFLVIMEKFTPVDSPRKEISLHLEVLIVMSWSDSQDSRKRKERVFRA